MQNGIMPTYNIGHEDKGLFGGAGLMGFLLGTLLPGLYDRGRWGGVGAAAGFETGVTPTLFFQGIQSITSGQQEAMLSNVSNFGDIKNAIRNSTDVSLAATSLVGEKVSSGNFALLDKLCNGFCGGEKTTLGVGAALGNKIDCVDRNLSTAISGVNTLTQSSLSDLNYRMLSGFDGVNTRIAASTCDIIQSGKDNTTRVIDWLNNDKISSLAAENAELKANANRRSERDSFIEISNRQTAIGSAIGSNNHTNVGAIIVETLSPFVASMRSLAASVDAIASSIKKS
jgi:hypothetical protein